MQRLRPVKLKPPTWDRQRPLGFTSPHGRGYVCITAKGKAIQSCCCLTVRVTMGAEKPGYLIHEGPSPEVKAHFVGIPWCETLYSDPSYTPFNTLSKLSPGSTFIGETLSTSSTIKAWQSFYKAPSPGSVTGSHYYLLSVGDGVNGHIGKAHGGFIAVLMDEVIGGTAMSHCPPDGSTMTAFMKVDFKKPLDTPRVVLAKGWIEEDRSQGRKIFGRGSLEDGEGGVYATGEALFLIVDRTKVGLKL